MIESTRHELENSEGYTVINCSGNLNIEAASELKTSLHDALNQNGDIVLNVENVERIDTSCLQIFCSLFKTASLAEKIITWESVSDVFSDTAKLLAVNEVIALP